MYAVLRIDLQAVFAEVGLDEFVHAGGAITRLRTGPWLFGHSDGGSIALLYAAHFPDQVSGVVTVAPHILVEPVTIANIGAAREAYLQGDLRRRLGRYHADVDSAFWGWSDIWLDPAFRSWSIETELIGIRCPVIAIQGDDDEYGTRKQVYGIKRRVPTAQVLVLAKRGHSPHRDQASALSRAAGQFITTRRV